MPTAELIYLLLGANLGDRATTLARAAELLSERVGPVRRASGVYETAPWGPANQPAYLNQVLELSTTLPPEAVLTETQRIETELGRVRRDRWGARLIDIDLLYYGHYVLHTERLTVPHPRLPERRFTLVPLAEIAPHYVHPVLHQSNADLLAACSDGGAVTLVLP